LNIIGVFENIVHSSLKFVIHEKYFRFRSSFVFAISYITNWSSHWKFRKWKCVF